MSKHRIFKALALGLMSAGTAALASNAASTDAFEVRGLAPHVTMMSVLPGAVVPLDARDPETGHALDIHWKVTGGSLTHHAQEAVWCAPEQTGVYRLEGTGTVGDRTYRQAYSAFVCVPAAEAKFGTIRGYHVGHYPALYEYLESSRGMRSFPALPAGFIKLDAESAHAKVGRYFTLGQFAVKDGARSQKYMMLSPRLIAKLERVIDDLNAGGHPTHSLRIMSGYRTPAYNEGIGNKTTLSRHTYGDAADVLVDDWDHDGAITQHDAMILYTIADHLDHTTDLTGGLSMYRPTANHGWFVHIDARGKAARW